MTVLPADVEVCLPGRGCAWYVPAEGHALNALIAVGPQVLDGFLAAVLGALVLIAAVAAAMSLRTSRARDHRSRTHRGITVAGALLIGSGAIAAVPILVPAVAPVSEVFALSASSTTGVALLVLAGAVSPAARAALVAASALRLLMLPLTVLQVLLAAPLGSLPTDVVTTLGDLLLLVAAVLLLVGRGRLGALRWALLLPPVAALLTGVRRGLPFPAAFWIDLLPVLAVVVTGLLVLTGRSEAVAPARRGQRTSVLASWAAAALASTLVVLLAWPTPPGARTAGEPEIGPVAVVTASTRLPLPLDRYRQSESDRDVVIRAENALIRTCASRRGVGVSAADLIPREVRISNTSWVGLIDARRAAASGYWAPPWQVAAGGVQSSHDLRVLTHCVSAARARLGDDGAPQRSVSRAAFDALARADADSRVGRLRAAWSRCMQLRGFAFASPRDVALTQEMTFPTPDDTRAATASVSCEQATNLPGLRTATLAAYEQRAIAEHGGSLRSARSLLLMQTRTATAVLRGAAPQAPSA